jgi:3-oxoacyl-[acyl-carrier protein] reductase
LHAAVPHQCCIAPHIHHFLFFLTVFTEEFSMRLNKKVAIITGGAQGIGLTTALKFAGEGATVVLWDVNADKGAAVVADFTAKGHECSFQLVNVADAMSVTAAAKEVFEKYGRIDILVNNAGITRDATLMKMTSEQWNQVIDINLTGVFNCAQSVAPFMAENGFGRILNASSVVGIHGNFGQTNYVAAKSALIGMTKVWAKELGKKGITVNAVAPGFIATEMIKTMPEKVVDMMRDRTPLARVGAPEDIANAYLFLASDEASFITGTTLSVDGGLVV